MLSKPFCFVVILISSLLHIFTAAHISKGKQKTSDEACAAVCVREKWAAERNFPSREISWEKLLLRITGESQRQSRAAEATEEKTAEWSWIFSRFILWFCSLFGSLVTPWLSLLHPYKNSLANVTHRAHQDSWVFQRFSLSPSPRKKFLWMKFLLELRRGCEKSWGYHGMF